MPKRTRMKQQTKVALAEVTVIAVTSILLAAGIADFKDTQIINAKASQEQEQRKQESEKETAAKVLDESLSDLLTLEQARDTIGTMTPSTAVTPDRTPGLKDCQSLIWTFPAELVNEPKLNGTDSKGIDRYSIGTKEDAKSKLLEYMLMHPEMKPEVEAGCTTALDEFDRLEVATEGSSSDVWIEPLSTGILTDESK